MSTTLIVLAVILALFALVLIPFMMVKSPGQQKTDTATQVNQGRRAKTKKKKRR